MLRTPAGPPGQRILTEGCLSRSLWWTFWSGRCHINPLTCLHLHRFINEHLRFAASLATTFLVTQGSGWCLFPSFRISFSLFFNGKCASKTWPKHSFGQINFFSLLFKWHHAARERMCMWKHRILRNKVYQMSIFSMKCNPMGRHELHATIWHCTCAPTDTFN